MWLAGLGDSRLGRLGNWLDLCALPLRTSRGEVGGLLLRAGGLCNGRSRLQGSISPTPSQGSVGNWWLCIDMRGFEQLPGEDDRQAVSADRVTLRPGRGSSGAGQRGTEGLDGSSLKQAGASPEWREKLGVSLFPNRGEQAENLMYCVHSAHATSSQDPLGEQGASGRAGRNRVTPRGFLTGSRHL